MTDSLTELSDKVQAYRDAHSPRKSILSQVWCAVIRQHSARMTYTASSDTGRISVSQTWCAHCGMGVTK